MIKEKFKKAAKELVAQMTLDEKISQLWHTAPAIERLGVPAYNWWSEAPHGSARCGCATVFPQSIGMAASFNSELLQEVGSAVSDEVRAKYNEYKKQGFTDIYQGLTICGPVINIARDPRWGRISETYGEDPYLTGRMGAAYINGLQGNGEYRKADSVVQHYAVHSGPENGRLSVDFDATDEDLFETYLWAFEYCIKNADPSMILPAYNKFRGIPCCASEYLLKEVLREKFGFERVTMTDAGEVEYSYKIQDKCKTMAEMAAWCVNNGSDISIGDDNEGFIYKHLREAYDQGLISEETITDCVERVFELRFEKGLFAKDCEYDNIPYERVECDEHRKLNKKMSQESVVLLKNDGILPLDPNMKVAVIGPNADEKLVLLGNYYGYPTHTSTFLQGMQKKAENIYFARGYTPSFAYEKENDTPMYEAFIAAQKSDVVVMFMGLDPTIESEECDFDGDKKDLEMPEKQKALYDLVKKAGKPIVYVNVSGSCVNLEKQKEECNALLQCFYPGAEGGDALAEILYGEVSPSGRLPLTFYKDCSELPNIEDYSMKNRTYRFYEGKPVYEFGYGLTYSDISEEWIDENTVKVENKGNYDTGYSVLKFETKPHKKLVDFKKIFIRKGECAEVKFS